MSELELKLKLTADGKGMTGTVRASREQIEQLNKSVEGTGDAGRKGSKGLDATSKSAGDAANSGKGLNDQLKTTVARYASLAAVLLSVRKAYNSVTTVQDEYERNTLRTQAIIRATGETAGFTAEQLQVQASDLARATLQGVDGVQRAQQVLLSFRSIAGDTFTRTTELAADLATVTGTSLTSAITQLGKALEDPTQGITALRRSGVSFTEAQRDVINSLVETNQLGEAQKLILDELSRQYGGVARAEAMGLAGAKDTLAQSFEELSLAVGRSSDVGGVLVRVYGRITDIVDELTARISSGQLAASFEYWSFQLSEFGRDFEHTMSMVNEILLMESNDWGRMGGEAVDILVGAFRDFPANVRTFIQLVTVEIAALVDRASAYGSAIASYLDPRTWFSADRREGIGEQLSRDLDVVTAARRGSIEAIMAERDATLRAGEQIIEAGERKRQQWEREKESFDAYSADLSNSLQSIGESGSLSNDELEKMADRLRQLERAIDPVTGAFADFAENQAFLDDALAAGLLSPERYRDLTDRLVQSLAGAGDEGGKEAADNFEREMRAASERVASSLQNAITSGDWGGVGASIGGALAGAIGGMVTESLMQQMSGSAGAAIFGPIGGAIAGGIVGLAANQLGGFFSLGDWDPTAERQASQGAGSVLGDINAKSESIARATRSVSQTNEELVGLNRGMLQALQTLQTGITGASTRVAQGRARADVGAPSINANLFENFGVLGGAAETYLNTVGEMFTLGLFDSLGSSIGKLLGGRSRKVDEGINVVGGALADLMDETIVEAYSTFRVKKNFLSSTKTREQTQRLGGDVANQFSLVFESIFDSVFAAGSALGMSDSELQRRLGGFRVGDLRISLEGLNAEQQQKEIEAVFGKVFDDLALYALPFLEDFQRAGEGLGETLARVASQTQVAEEAAKRLGFGWANLADRQLVAASERLVEAAGGLEQFIGSMESFISNFASEAEQFAIAQSDITRALAEQNLMLPATRDGYFELLQAQNGATQAGAENIATLLRLQGVADKYYTMLEDSASELLRKQRDEYSAALQEAERAAMSVRSAIDGLNRSSGAFLDTSRAAAQEYLRGLVNRGAVPGGRQLDAALSSVTDIRADQFASFNDYIAEVSSTGRLLADLDEITRAQVTVEQQMLDRLDRQAELLERGNAEQLAALAQIQGSVDRNTQAIQAAPRGGAVSSRIGGGTGTVSATQDVAREIRQMKSEMVEFQKSIDRHSQRTARILERIERDGLEVRQ